MSTFTVRIEMLAFPKGDEKRTLDETYRNWADADTAYEAYQKACKIPGSRIQHVEFIEHREERVHKAFSKPTGTTIEGTVVNTHNDGVIHVLQCASAG